MSMKSNGIQEKIEIEYYNDDHGTQELESFTLAPTTTDLDNNHSSISYDIKRSVTEYNFIKLIEDTKTLRYKIEYWYIHKQPGAVQLYSVEYLPMSSYRLTANFIKGDSRD